METTKQASNGFRQIPGLCIQVRILEDGKFEILGKMRNGDSMEELMSRVALHIQREMKIRKERGLRKQEKTTQPDGDEEKGLFRKEHESIRPVRIRGPRTKLSEIVPLKGKEREKKIAG